MSDATTEGVALEGMTDPAGPRTAAGQDALHAVDMIGETANLNIDLKAWNKRILAIEAEARAGLDVERATAAAENESAVAALYRLFLTLDTLDGQAWDRSPDDMVKVTGALWRDRISPDLQMVRSALYRKPQP